MRSLSQSPKDDEFVQNPYPFYERARAVGPFFLWNDYGLICTGNSAAVNAILRDRRFGREPVTAPVIPPHLAPFYAVEAHSMLELEPPRHTRLRNLVLRAFTSRRIAGLGADISALASTLAEEVPDGTFDLLHAFAQPLPVRIIARLLGVPEEMAPDLLRWSNAMVGMYMAGRTRAAEDRAVAATEAFVTFLRGYIEQRRKRPADDLITQLVAAESEGDKLSTDELISTCILLLNAGHEATVHTIGNGVKLLLETGTAAAVLNSGTVDAAVEEILRFDPALHMFTRHAYDDVEVMGHSFRRGDQVGLLLAMANRDPGVWDEPARFIPADPSGPLPPLVRGCTSASARLWRGWNCRWRCRSFSDATRACVWPKRPDMPMPTTSTAWASCWFRPDFPFCGKYPHGVWGRMPPRPRRRAQARRRDKGLRASALLSTPAVRGAAPSST